MSTHPLRGDKTPFGVVKGPDRSTIWPAIWSRDDGPLPTCPGEEMALHPMLGFAESAVTDRLEIMTTTTDGLPDHKDDSAWHHLLEDLFQDHDIISLFDSELDGIEDPDSEHYRQIAMGDYRPQAWFDSFRNAGPRDGRRRFRR